MTTTGNPPPTQPRPSNPRSPANTADPPAALDAGWRVERINTEPMTAQQYDTAVAALAVLIVQWQRLQHTDDTDDQAA